MNKVAAVIVTYNRLELLKVVITATRNQSLRPDGIVIVNNGSTDGTMEWLNDQDDLIMIHQENCGGSGGFYRGMKEGYDRGYEWIWVMDDDGYPKADCLEKLYENNNKFKEGLVALSSAVYNCDDKLKLCMRTPLVDKKNIKYFDIFLNPFEKLKYTKDPEVAFSSFEKKDGLIEFLTYPFNSVMYNRKIFSLIGFPMKELFIRGDEVEFTLRIVKNKIPSFLVPESIFYNPSQEEDDKKITSVWKLKYAIRNRIIITKKYVPFFSAIVYCTFIFLRVLKQGRVHLITPFFDGLFSRIYRYNK